MKFNKKIFLFLGIYVLCFIYSFFFSTVYNDEIWNYGFAYNIASGLIPYRDFGMLQTPLYFYLASIFIKIFGNYLYSFHLFNSIVLACIIFICYEKLGKKSFILLPFIFLNCYPGYNIFSVLLMLILVNITDKDFVYKDFFMGLLLGLMFLTKQHIGICLLVPLLFYSKNRIKGIIGFISPIMLLVIYLIFNNALYEFIDYAFLGIFEFGENNGIWLFFPVEVIICFIIAYKLFKSKFGNRRLFYILMYQIVTVPIFDDYHFMIGFIPVLYYILLVSNIENYKIKYYIIISLAFFVCWNFKIHEFEGINFYTDSNSYLYGRNIPVYVNLDSITDYIVDNKNNYDHIYFFSKNAFYVKLNAKYPLDKYDMILNGNMGYNGASRYIDEIDRFCFKNKCMFILYKYEFDENNLSQTNIELVDYVKNTFSRIEEVDVFYIYSNDIII